ncbi:MAG: 3-phosphoshikimate 1-carboxyvinyltransferase [Bacteroidales bacterium]|nr:3-phosphoshikimate 1-carboxyvinyltransferase [Bacteroidales bacterium]
MDIIIDGINPNDIPTKISDLPIALPASKSICNRVLTIIAQTDGGGDITNVSDCDDTNAIINAITMHQKGEEYINVGAAGTAMRFMTAFLALRTKSTVTIDGSARMRKRPIKELVDVLCQLGAKIEYAGDSDSCPPLRIYRAPMQGGTVSINGSISSQYISALMMIAPGLRKGLTIDITGGLVSLPYVEMTAKIMRDFGAQVWCSDKSITIKEGEYLFRPYSIENDWSAASYWYEIRTLIPEVDIQLRNLQCNSCQGDSKVAEIFKLFGVETEYTKEGVLLTYHPETVAKRIDIDLKNQPDLAQTIVVTACLKGIPFKISGLSTLRIKETDRIAALISQLGKLGYIVRETEDATLESDSVRHPIDEAPSIETFDDHRMAMAFAPASIVVPGITIEDAEVVSKSYPKFWDHLRLFGFRFSELEQ